MKISGCTVFITTGKDRDKALSILEDFHNNLKGNPLYVDNEIILTDLRDLRHFNNLDDNYLNGNEGLAITVSENIYFDISTVNVYPKHTDLT